MRDNKNKAQTSSVDLRREGGSDQSSNDEERNRSVIKSLTKQILEPPNEKKATKSTQRSLRMPVATKRGEGTRGIHNHEQGHRVSERAPKEQTSQLAGPTPTEGGRGPKDGHTNGWQAEYDRGPATSQHNFRQAQDGRGRGSSSLVRLALQSSFSSLAGSSPHPHQSFCEEQEVHDERAQ